MSSPASGPDWALAGLSPEQTESMMKTGQQMWETSPAGRKFSLLRSVLPTVMSYQGAMALQQSIEDLKEGKRMAAVERARGIPLSPDLQRSFGVKSYGDLINAFGDDAPRILDFHATVQNRREMARMREDQQTFYKWTKLQAQHASIAGAAAKLRDSIITADDVASMYAQGMTKDQVDATIRSKTLLDKMHLATEADYRALQGYNSSLRRLEGELYGAEVTPVAGSENTIEDAATFMQRYEAKKAAEKKAADELKREETIRSLPRLDWLGGGGT